MVKLCTGCGIKKDISHFHQDSRAKLKIHSICKSCRLRGRKKTYILDSDILKLIKNNRGIKVEYFGFSVGILFHIRKNEILAISLLKGSKIFNRKSKARVWLCRQAVIAGDRIRAGLMKRISRSAK